jgi:hypothetical protein
MPSDLRQGADRRTKPRIGVGRIFEQVENLQTVARGELDLLGLGNHGFRLAQGRLRYKIREIGVAQCRLRGDNQGETRLILIVAL